MRKPEYIENPFEPFFLEAAHQQHVVLDEAIVRAGTIGYSENSLSFEPDGRYAAIAEAALILRRYPHIPLASHTLRTRPTLAHPSTAEDTLRGIINASVEPVVGTQEDAVFTSYGTRGMNACDAAETVFASVFRQLKNPSKPLITPNAWNEAEGIGYEILTGVDQRPIALRKANGVPSTLSLEPMVINGVPVPAGSLLRVELEKDYQETRRRHIPAPAKGVQTALPVTDIRGISFLRLTGYALPPEERAVEFLPSLADINENYELFEPELAETHIEQVRELAGWVLKGLMEK